jgi:predicted TIM-barrel fold metal-dependent hydrolase
VSQTLRINPVLLRAAFEQLNFHSGNALFCYARPFNLVRTLEFLQKSYTQKAGNRQEEALLTRREMLARTAVAGCLLPARRALAKASQPATVVNFDVPPDACDCHTHIFGDPARFPLFAGRTYTPEPASPEEMSALHRSLHIDRVVIVTPSVYGVDNSATLYGMKARGASARGVAVIDGGTPEGDLDAMERAGIRGIRLNLATAGQNDPALARRHFEDAVTRLKKRNWHVQMYTNLAIISSIQDLVAAAPMPVVFDHFGGAEAGLGVGQPGFADLVALVRSGKAYVKLSGAYRASAHGPDYPDVTALARALIEANPERVIWGSDWPHPGTTAPGGRPKTEVTPLLQIDDGRLLNRMAVWAPDAAVRKKILVDNPARLYGF